MDIKDEINQINEVIKKIDIIQDDEWQQQEGETLEDYNDRIESIEEDIEEELLDYISDSLLAEQEINEQEAIKEAQEKIENDYELFNDAFIKSEKGTITLKNEDELASLWYDSPEEIEKLKEIEKNINSPETYINKIKESIRASKDIDAEIDRKMELAKSIISAKKRGETLPSSLNPSLEIDKFEKANEYIASTITLRKIPIIQKEYVNNNYIAERRYDNLIRYNINNSANTRNRTTNTTANSRTYASAGTTVPKIVLKKIPERKNTVYTNFEKKLDKDNDLTKQKIKARTELKVIFKQIEDKELSKEEVEELNLKIDSIKKKYPNTITDKTLNKLYDTFKVKLPTVDKEQEHENTEKEKNSGIEEIQQKLNEGLEEINNPTEVEDGENKRETDELKKQVEEVVASIEKVKKEPEATEIKPEQPTSAEKNKATGIALGALVVGEAIGTTIGAIKQKGENKIEQLKKKGEEVVEKIAQQQKKTRKKKATSTTLKKETKSKKGKVETPKAEEEPVVQSPTDNAKDKTKKKNDVQPTKIEPTVVTPSPKMSRKELLESLKKAEAHSSEYIHAKGINLLIINKLICYLKDNNDPEIQERLNREISKLQTDRYESADKLDELYIYNHNQTNIQTLKYMYDSYKDGVKSTDGSRDIISANPNAAAYYLYLAYNVAKDINSKGKESDKKEIIDKFESDKEETCYRYFEFLKGKYNIDDLDSINRLKAEALFMNELESAKKLKTNNSEYLDLAIAMEFVSRPRENSLYTSEELDFKKKIQTFENKIKNGEKVDSKILKLLGNMHYNGLKTVVGEDIIIQDKRKARDMYEKALDEKEMKDDVEIYCKLIDIYSDKATPLYDKAKTDKLLKDVAEKGLKLQKKKKETTKSDSSTYVCSDLHGAYPVYQAIISQLKEKDKLYILGDVIDRGTDGIKILQDVMKRKEKGQVEFLIGNHELMMIQSLFLANEKVKQDWLSSSNGGNLTLESFEKLKSDEKNKIREFLLDSYVYKNIEINSQNIHLVHAKSIQDKNDNSNKTVREMLAEGKEKLLGEALWTRDADGKRPHKNSAKSGIFTVIGHSPTRKNMIEYKNGALDIDCGAGGDEIASLVNLTTGKIKYFSVRHEREKIEKVNNKQQEK